MRGEPQPIAEIPGITGGGFFSSFFISFYQLLSVFIGG